MNADKEIKYPKKINHLWPLLIALFVGFLTFILYIIIDTTLLVEGFLVGPGTSEIHALGRNRGPVHHGLHAGRYRLKKKGAGFRVQGIGKDRISSVLFGGKPQQLIEAALAASAETIINGDSHLLALETFRDIPIFTPAACLEKYKLG